MRPNNWRIVFVSLSLCSCALGAPLDLVTWNVESGDNDPAVIAAQLGNLPEFHLYGLAEVDPVNAGRYRQAVGDQFESLMSETGFRDRLLMMYDRTRLELLEQQELARYEGLLMNDVNRRHRSPLFATFRDRVTEESFKVVLVHLARGSSSLRTEQATALRAWLQDQTLPVLGIGDFNFDYSIVSERGNLAYKAFVLDDYWRWVRPDPLIDTNWSDSDGNGHDNFPNSVLDFAFVGGQARPWVSESEVVVRVDDFPDDNSTSDHRPVSLRITEMWTPEPGDVDWDRQVTVADLDLLTAKLLADTEDFAFDVNGDRSIDRRDRDVWIREVRQLYVGDANLDGGFDDRDIVQVFVSGEYRDGLAQNSTWATGDWDGDGEFDERDLVAAFIDGGYNKGPRGAMPVPEPNACWLAWNVVCIGFFAWRALRT